MENEKVKYPIKSEKYKGVYQRKNGKWFYRVKKIKKNSTKPEYYQKGGFLTDKIANEAKITRLKLEGYPVDAWSGEDYKFSEVENIKFSDSFAEFLNSCESDSSRTKYKSIYKRQLSKWADKYVNNITDSDIDILLFKLALQGYKQSYISSVRKVLKFYFKYARHVHHTTNSEIAQFISTKPYKLRVLSLFSGIGAPEQALKELGIDFELVNYCEFDNKASYAYSLLHNVDMSLDLVDVENIDFDYSKQALPNFDIMFFGSPCVDLSKQGKQKGLLENKEDELPSTWQLEVDDLPELTRSGLIYRALQIALYKKPKFMIAENVANFTSKTFKKEFNAVIRNLQDMGYSFYWKKLISSKFGIPQNRNRVFMIMIREDVNIKYEWPQTQELTFNAEDWFLPPEEVAEEYYIKPAKHGKLDRESFKPNFKRDIISCITTKWGEPDPNSQQTFIEDSKGIRCLTSEELMRFQGFPVEYAKILRDNGYDIGDIGKLVGNSITVPVIKAVLEQLILGIKEDREREIPGKVIEAKVEGDFIPPLFAYMGNKMKLLPYINYLLPIQNEFFMDNFVFVDVFTGSGAVAVNTKANRVIMNDIDPFLINVYKGLNTTPPEKAWELIMGIVNKYNLSKESNNGYKQCREDYNNIPFENRGDYWYWGLTLVYHSYNRNHVSHNKKKEYNSSFGWDKVNLEVSKGRFMPFAEKLYKGNFEFSNKSYKEIVVMGEHLDEGTIYYFDPPYLASEATYNKGWSVQDELDLYEFIDECSKKGIKWMLSNVLENNGETNPILASWIKDNLDRYGVYYMNRKYTGSTANRKDKGETVEIIVTSEKL